MTKYIPIILNKIQKEYPFINIHTNKIENDFYIVIDSKQIYDDINIKFKELVLKLKFELLLKNNIHNVYFTYDEEINIIPEFMDIIKSAYMGGYYDKINPTWDETTDKAGYFGEVPFCGRCKYELDETMVYCPKCTFKIGWDNDN